MALSALCVAAEKDAEESRPYRIGGGETITISQNMGQQGFRQVVTSDGTISVPTGATVKVLGKTLAEAQQLVREKMQEESGERRVRVSLLLESVPTKKAFFSGEVRTPQALELPTGKALNLLQALTLVGGPTDFADLSRVNIIRSPIGAERKSIEVDASRLGMPGNVDLGPVLEPDDMIIIPRGDVFVLAGEFARTGPISRRELLLSKGEPARISRVLFVAGGLKPTANRRTMRLIRTTKTGEKQVIPVDLDAATGLPSTEKHKDAPAGESAEPADKKAEKKTEKADKPEPEMAESEEVFEEDVPAAPEPNKEADLVLQDGDVLTVAGSGGVIILGRVKSPGLYALPAPTLKLSRLIAMAGGFSDFAKGSSVTVIRSGPPKKVLSVDVNAVVKDGHLEKDVELEDGDYVFVGERVL